MLQLKAAAVTAVAAGALLIPTPPASPPAPPIVVIMMENHGRQAVITDAADMPYEVGLWNGGALRFTQYYAIAHPSYPNYATLASGNPQTTSDQVTAGEFAAPTLWDQLTSAGVTWAVALEAMPQACYPKTAFNDPAITNGRYKIGHNPAVTFAGVYASAECQNVIPASSLSPGSLPQVTLLVPNLCDDMHGLSASDAATAGYQNCVAGSAQLEQRSDGWLASEVGQLTSAGATVIITYDEAGTWDTRGVNGSTGAGGLVYAVEAGAGVTPGSSSTQLNHASILAALEDWFALPRLGSAASANPLPLP